MSNDPNTYILHTVCIHTHSPKYPGDTATRCGRRKRCIWSGKCRQTSVCAFKIFMKLAHVFGGTDTFGVDVCSGFVQWALCVAVRLRSGKTTAINTPPSHLTPKRNNNNRRNRTAREFGVFVLCCVTVLRFHGSTETLYGVNSDGGRVWTQAHTHGQAALVRRRRRRFDSTVAATKMRKSTTI